ncbi:MAG: Ni/Fe-hydrogenase cytochrome b subunit [Desulfovibrio sp.]|jgi:Ni/Fe-hydrogenase subunit HybB-like protein|nr:Ni/Fe-hydrogenase cytochrome b subunit [Desulfovibrio sp.]
MNTTDRKKTALLELLRTPGNVLTAFILALGLCITVLRFTKGLAGVTNLNDNYPWGIWISFDLLCGVALAAGGYAATTACHLFGLTDFRTSVRPAVTSAFLGYAFVVIALHYDVGQPWRLVYPIFLSQGTSSVLFEVGLCVFLYLSVLALEWSTAAFERLGWKKARARVVRLTVPLTVLGVILSTMHQSSLGALYLIAPSKMHPLWYSPFIPVFFFVSSIFAGMSMVIFEGSLTRRFLRGQMDEEHVRRADAIVFGFGKAASVTMMGYLLIRLYGIALDDNWSFLPTGYGLWFIAELAGFVALPAFLYALGVREKNTRCIRFAAILTIAGIVLNRFNVSLVAFNWQLAPEEKYFPHWMEIAVSVFIVTLIITAYRLICAYMPVLRDHPDFETH